MRLCPYLQVKKGVFGNSWNDRYGLITRRAQLPDGDKPVYKGSLWIISAIYRENPQKNF